MRRPLVVKLGGSTLSASDHLLREIADLWRSGEEIVLVHGGGKDISRVLGEAGIEAEFRDGLRVTGDEALPLVVEALDEVNEALVRALSELGVACKPFPADKSPLIARRIDGLGHVGRVTGTELTGIQQALESGRLPVVSPVARSTEGLPLNVNGDTAAAALAVAVKAGHLVFITDVEGLRTQTGELLPLVHIDDAAVLIADGTAGGGMAPKLTACMQAAGAGINTAIVDGRREGVLSDFLAGMVYGTRIGAPVVPA